MNDHLLETYRLRRIIDKQISQLTTKHKKFFDDNFKDEKKLNEFLLLVSTGDESLFKNPTENEIRQEFFKVKSIYNDLKTMQDNFNIKVDEEHRRLEMPIWVERHPKLKWIEKWDEIITPSFELNKSFLLPHEPYNNDYRLDDGLDSNVTKYLDYRNSIQSKEEGVVSQLSNFDVDEKDNDLVRRSQILGEVLNKIATNVEQSISLAPDNQSKQLDFPDRPKEISDSPVVGGKMFTSEITRMFYLNNKDPVFYNIDFFVGYFDINKTQLLRIVRNMSFPMLDISGERVERIFRFIENN